MKIAQYRTDAAGKDLAVVSKSRLDRCANSQVICLTSVEYVVRKVPDKIEEVANKHPLQAPRPNFGVCWRRISLVGARVGDDVGS